MWKNEDSEHRKRGKLDHPEAYVEPLDGAILAIHHVDPVKVSAGNHWRQVAEHTDIVL